MSALLTEDWHYIRNGWGREQLYAYRSDSLELRNVVRGPALQDVLLTLRRQLDSALAAARAGQPKPQKLAASPASPQPR